MRSVTSPLASLHATPRDAELTARTVNGAPVVGGSVRLMASKRSGPEAQIKADAPAAACMIAPCLPLPSFSSRLDFLGFPYTPSGPCPRQSCTYHAARMLYTVSSFSRTLRPPPNVDFVQGKLLLRSGRCSIFPTYVPTGYPGIPPGPPDRPQAAVKGVRGILFHGIVVKLT